MRSLITTLSLLALTFTATAQDLRGFRGDWNRWGYISMTLAVDDVWRVTVQAPANVGDSNFKLAGNSSWSNQWTYGTNLPLAEIKTAHTWGENSSINATGGRHYTFAMENANYGVASRMIVQETPLAPISLLAVAHQLDDTQAVVSVQTSATPSNGEKIYVRYSLNNWATSSFVAATGSGTNWTATITFGATDGGKTCSYYVLTTTVASPTHADAPLQTLAWNDHNGENYSYLVPGEAPPDDPSAAELYINEVLSSNDTGAQDEDGDYSDWMEIWNAGDSPVNLAGWGLSDSYSNPFKWTFGDVTIQPNEFLIVWASSKDRRVPSATNALHANFAISAGGEEVTLTRPDGTLMDELQPIAIPTDFSRGRFPDGAANWLFFAEPTPGAANTTQGFDAWLQPPLFSVPGGIYTTNVSLELSSADEGVTIRYTLDGSEPTASSPIYSGALILTNRTRVPNDLSDIPTNYQDPGPPYYEGWQPPDGKVFKFSVVRARAFRDGAMTSPSVSHSYIVDAAGTNRFTLPIVSIGTGKANLFDDDIGIYTPVNDNMWQSGSAWERPGSIEFFEPDGTLAFSGPVGLRLHGNTTRNRPRKAIRVYSRGSGPFEYQIFPDKPLNKFGTFILRNGGNDWGNGVIRDLFLQSLAENANMERQYGRPVLVFLDGEYWGIHDLRERFDDDYHKYNHGLDEPEYVQVEIDRTTPFPDVPVYDNGNPDLGGDFSNLWHFVETHDLTDAANYAAVADRLDLLSFMDFYQANIFFGNTDWPGNNTRIWRSAATNRTEGAPAYLDARWRYMLYDTDFGFGLPFFYVPGYNEFAQHNTLAYAAATNGGELNQPDATIMFHKLLANDEFRENFIVRFADHLNTAYSRANVTSRWAEMVATVAPEMDEHVRRWRQPTDWAAECNRIRSYGEQRTAAVWGHLQSFFQLNAPKNLTLAVSNAAAGFVRINNLDLNETTAGFSGYPWTGAYFTNYPITLTAQTLPGYHFVEWRKAVVEDGILAADQAANYSNWTDGSNQGSGFGAWALDADGSNAGFFIGAGWGLWANSGDTATASRPFSEALAVGQTFSVRLDHGSIENGGEVRVTLQNSAGNDLWTFAFVGGEGHYRLNGSATAIPYTDASIAIALTLTSATTFSANITPSVSGSGATTLTGNLISQSDSSIRRFQARNTHAGDGSEADMFVDNLQIAAAASSAEPVFYSNDPAITVTLDGPTLFEAVYEEGELKETALIHYWNFNDAAALLTPTYTLKAGANIQVDLGATTEVLAGTGQDFAGENARFNDEAGSHLRINNPIGAALNVASPTVGFEDIVIRFETRRSGKGAGEEYVSYTLDGTNYTAFTTIYPVDGAPLVYTLDFSAIAEANNNPNFGIRIEFAQGAGGTAGNNRFDNWTVEGVALDGLNLPPEVIAPIAHQSFVAGNEAAEYNIANVFTDPDMDALTYDAQVTDATVAQISRTGATLTVTPLKRGGATVTLTANDGHNPPISSSFYVLVYPEAHTLADAPYTFTQWSAQEPHGAYPAHMIFLQGTENDSQLTSPLIHAYDLPVGDLGDPENDDAYPYDGVKGTRMNGLGENGVAFINTGRGRDLGGALIALDTRGVSNAPVTWLGGTVLPNARIYAIRLQYRIGATGNFVDVLDGNDAPIEYLRNETEGHSQTMPPVLLPAAALGQEYVQVLWRYYWANPDPPKGARAQLRLDNIRVNNRLAGFPAWQLNQFSPAELAAPAISGPTATDAQGIPNLLRYAFGMSRTDDYDACKPTGSVTESRVFFHFRRLLALDSGLEYIVEAVADMNTQNWATADDIGEPATEPTGDGLTEIVTCEIPAISLDPTRFFRLKVRLLP